MNIFDILGKIAIEITTPTNLGMVNGFVFSSRLKKLLYVKTNENYYIDFKKIKLSNNIILVDETATIDITNYTIIDKDCVVVNLEGNVVENISEISVNNNGNNTIIKVNDKEFTYKDVYNSGYNLIILQGKNRKKPVKKNDNKNRDIVIVFPTEKNDVNLEEIAPKNTDNNACNENIDTNLSKNANENNDNNAVWDSTTKKTSTKNTITISEPVSKLPNKIICNTSLLEGRTLKTDIYLNDTEKIEKNTTLTKQIINYALQFDKIVEITKNS